MELHEKLKEYMHESFDCVSDHPWASTPEFEVFRHSSSRKWFALVMKVPQRTLGLEGEGELHVVNLKCEPRLIGSLVGKGGFFPAYHMNKEQWITAALDGTADWSELEMLVGLSYELTAPKLKKARKNKTE